MSKTVIIGLDGACFDLIAPWAKSGELPNFKKLLENSTTSELNTVMPPMTLPAWNSLATGRNPGKHGTFDFTERIPGTLDLKVVNSSSRKAKTMWNILSDNGKRVCVGAVPGNYPPQSINGIMVSGFDAPSASPDSMYPSEIYETLNREVGGYEQSADFARALSKGDVKASVSAMLNVIDKKARAMKYLYQMEDWDCFMYLFGETDAVVHYFWKYHDPASPHHEKLNIEDPVLTVYKKIDQIIGEFESLLKDDTTLFFVSDHGVGGAGDKVVYLNRWLEQEGFLNFSYRNMLTLKSIEHIKSWLKACAPIKVMKQLRFGQKGLGYRLESYLRFKAFDWSETKAFSEETPYYPNIWINVKGREPMGRVESGKEYRLLVKKIIERLKAWKDPETGSSMVSDAFPREEVYSGQYTHNAPDIVIDWNYDKGYSYLSRNSILSKKGVSVEKLDKSSIKTSKFMINRSGSHREKGIFIVKGYNIKKTATIDSVHITDIAPTILSTLNVPVPDDMDGRVLTDVFYDKSLLTSDLFKETDILKDEDISPTLSANEEDKIRQQLVRLGYLEE